MSRSSAGGINGISPRTDRYKTDKYTDSLFHRPTTRAADFSRRLADSRSIVDKRVSDKRVSKASPRARAPRGWTGGRTRGEGREIQLTSGSCAGSRVVRARARVGVRALARVSALSGSGNESRVRNHARMNSAYKYDTNKRHAPHTPFLPSSFPCDAVP